MFSADFCMGFCSFFLDAELEPRGYSLGLPRPLPRTGVWVGARVALGEVEAMVLADGDAVTPVRVGGSRACRLGRLGGVFVDVFERVRGREGREGWCRRRRRLFCR